MTLTIGSQTFTIANTDVYDPLDTVYTLDGLKVGWATNQGDPVPAFPQPVTASLRLATRDVANLGADAELGTKVWLRITGSGGVLVASLAGRIADTAAAPFRRGNVQWIAYDLIVVDYVADLAEIPITFSAPAQAGGLRITAISDAIVAAGGPAITGLVGAGQYFNAVDVVATPALDVLIDHLRQMQGVPAGVGGETGSHPVLIPRTTAGVLTSIGADVTSAARTATTWPMAQFGVVGSLLTLVFGGAWPAALLGYKKSLRIESNDVEESIVYRQDKNNGPNTVTVSGTWGSVTLTVRSAGEPIILLSLQSTLGDFVQGTGMAAIYVADLDRNRWRVESFVWRPDDADVAALPWPLMPDSETGDASCFVSQIAVTGIANKINPSGDSGFYAGTLDGASVQIVGGQLVVELAINHRLPLPAEWTTAVVGVTWDQLETQVGTGVKWNIGAQKADPALSWYETRLARKV